MSLRFNSIADLPAHLRPGVAAARVPEASAGRKYRNDRVQVDGLWFDSKLEARCYEGLKLRRAAGQVLWFLCQVSFPLEGGVVYRCDFLAALADGGFEVIDAKGKDTQASINKRKQVRARYGFDVILWRKA